MQFGPTVDGRIKISLESQTDYYFFAELVRDAAGDEQAKALADQVGKHTDDEDWDEYVKPELIQGYREDLYAVVSSVGQYQEEGLEEFFIDDEVARVWYSTLNQARLRLEVEHKISEVPYEITPEECGEELFLALVKSEHYLKLQSMILDHFEL